MRDFLLEIGVEEIPVTHLQPATDYLQASFEKMMREASLQYGSLLVSSTPRRLFILASQVQEMQADIRVEKTGPAKKIAYDEQGKLLPAALGFLKKNNATAQDLHIESTDKGEFIALSYLQAGRTASDILKEWILAAIPQIPWPKTMVWNESRLAFSRPLRWLCVLWGEEVIPLELAGVASSNLSQGNRWLGLDAKVKISSPGKYLEILRHNAVLAERTARRAALVQELALVFDSAELSVIPDDRLIDTVTDLVEYPTAVRAQFAPEFLALPEKIITSTISQNQKYFSVLQSAGTLSNIFVFVSNGDASQAELIRKGNEKVVAARLADALWYFREDSKVPLESYLPRLKGVVFQSKLGTMADRCQRILQIAEYLCAQLQLTAEQTKSALRTATLCKADLVTTMLGEKEFTKLQGYIGKQYALASGEPADVAEGIYEHYMPRGTNDSLPQTLSGAIVAVADKLDSVCGIIAVGLLPTGSADPFALRRAANGLVQIIVERNWELDFSALLTFALEQVTKAVETTGNANENIRAFFQQRVSWLLTQLGLDYDVLDSVAHLSLASLPDLKRRATALQSYRTREDFLRLVIGFKRVSNIIEGEEGFPALQMELFEAPQEAELHSSLQLLRKSIDQNLAQADYPSAIALLVDFGRQIDSFFDAVLVNCDDLQLRKNRHALLNQVKQEFLRVADISRIVIESDIHGVKI